MYWARSHHFGYCQRYFAGKHVCLPGTKDYEKDEMVYHCIMASNIF